MSEPLKKTSASVLGLGGAGAAVISALRRLPDAGWLKTIVVDTDSSTLAAHPADSSLAASSDWVLRDGSGCGGDVIRGERALARERANLTRLLEGCGLLVVAAGLGGGTATGGLRTIASLVRGLGIPSIFLLTTPFSFESYGRRKNADDCISELLPVTDILLVMPDDLLFSKIPPDSPVETAFELASTELARTAAGLASVLRCRDLIGSDYATFMAALRGRRSCCGCGVGVASSADGLDRCALALERMLESPFLGGLDGLKKADAVLLTLSAGPDLSLAEMKRTMEQATSLLDGVPQLLLGANSSPDLQNTVQLTAVAIRYDDVDPVRASTVKPASTARLTHTHSSYAARQAEPAVPADDLFAWKQDELPLTSFSRGVFDRYPATLYGDEDLDIPTFQRRNLSVDKGS